jgi:hypothetical protein
MSAEHEVTEQGLHKKFTTDLVSVQGVVPLSQSNQGLMLF